MTHKLIPVYNCLNCGETLTTGFKCNYCGFKDSVLVYMLIEERKQQRNSHLTGPDPDQLNLFNKTIS